MKKIFTCIALALSLSVGNTAAVQAQSTCASIDDNTSMAGTDFWFAIPPNEKDAGAPNNFLSVYVTAIADAQVYLRGADGFERERSIKAGETALFTTKNGSASWLWEVREEAVSTKGINVRATAPVIVNVLNSKQFSSEGFSVIPTKQLDRKYIHMAYYDFGENQFSRWGSGFVVVATEDNTNVNVRMRGKNDGGSNAKTLTDKKPGDVFNLPLLRKGQTYLIRGNGQTIGQFDISGTEITADKPIAVISFHQRTLMPVFLTNGNSFQYNGRDHLAEMVPPVSSWGKKFMTLEFERGNRGDLFRLVAAEPNTQYDVKFYNRITGEFLGQRSGLLSTAGEFAELDNVAANIQTPANNSSIRGVAVWETTKPVMLMQYAFSESWDRDNRFDPMYVVIPPMDSYVSGGYFQTPGESSFAQNILGLIVEGDPSDPEQTKLKSVEVNGKSLSEYAPNFLQRRIPGTNYWWVHAQMPQGVYKVTSQTKLGGYLYGYSGSETYVWPAMAAWNTITAKPDTQAPLIQKSITCGSMFVECFEQRNEAATADLGIRAAGIGSECSFNIELEQVAPAVIPPTGTQIARFRLNVIDLTQPAHAVFYVEDRAGNVAVDSFSYTPPQIVSQDAELNFRETEVNKTAEQQTTIRYLNTSPDSVRVTEVRLARTNSPYSLTLPTLPLTLAPGQNFVVGVQYKPVRISQNAGDLDQDSVSVITACNSFTLLKLRGRPVQTTMNVTASVAFPETEVDQTTTRAFAITNTGQVPVSVTGVQQPAQPFSVKLTGVNFPVVLAPQQAFTAEVAFAPKDEGEVSDSIRVTTLAQAAGSTPVVRSIPVSGTAKKTNVSVSEVDNSGFALTVSPTPIPENATIEYTIVKPGAVRLALFDMFGREVAVLEQTEKGVGRHYVQLSTDKLSNGAYLLRLDADGRQATLPVTITK